MSTIKDVADLAGVSLATASRVLTGNGASSEHSRRRVTEAAVELHYVVSGPARALRRARTDVLGLLLSDVRNPFFAELAHGAETEAGAQGYAVLLANADEDPVQEERHLRVFASQRVDGVLVAPQGRDGRAVAALVASGRPVVLVDRTLPGTAVPTVSVDNALGVRQAVEHLIGRGHHTIAYVGGPDGVSTSVERLAAFLQLREQHGLSTDPRLLAAGDYRSDSGAAAVLRVLGSGVRPTALLAADGLMSLGALTALRRRPESWARGVEVVSFDDAPWFASLDPPVSAVVNDAQEIGRAGVRTLLAVVAGRPAPSIRIPTTFVDRSPQERTRP